MRAGEACRLRLQLGGAEVVGAGVDQVADQQRGRRLSHHIVDPRRVAGQQDTRAFATLVLAVAGEAVLRDEPAERRRAGLAAVEAVAAGGQHLGQLGQAPGGEFACVRNDTHHRPVLGTLAGKNGVGKARRLQPLRGDRGAMAGWLLPEPRVEPLRVHQMDGAGRLAAIGLKQRGKLGHGGDLGSGPAERKTLLRSGHATRPPVCSRFGRADRQAAVPAGGWRDEGRLVCSKTRESSEMRRWRPISASSERAPLA